MAFDRILSWIGPYLNVIFNLGFGLFYIIGLTLYFKNRLRGPNRRYNISVCILLNSFDSSSLRTNNKTHQLERN